MTLSLSLLPLSPPPLLSLPLQSNEKIVLLLNCLSVLRKGKEYPTDYWNLLSLDHDEWVGHHYREKLSEVSSTGGCGYWWSQP